jgi:ABC-type dipeptide/oligopeptide/nickel transport system ATPase component
VGYVPQASWLPLDRATTVSAELARAVQLGGQLSLKHEEEDGKEDSEHGLLRALGLWPRETWAVLEVGHLSAGLRQRLLMALALSQRPELLVLDDPTFCLDAHATAQVLSVLKRHQWDRRMAFLIVTPDLGVVAQYCSRVLVLEAGKLVEDRSVNDWFATPGHAESRRILQGKP